ncbi:flagellar protein FliT [Halomonas vilamensis]|uniref:Flagellar protein FliT n=1 Tax=Vreelandella vilamensis TaxID=531309 RepID=A0ABU1H354_9GAMM|nr:flagellar protein FliT [Halomonas vilamensis]MDR5898730.1 flagellar protein FliT [Halomonas vilamensis]
MSASNSVHDQVTQQSLLDAYAALLDSAAYMHELANAEEWTALIEQRTHYVMLVEKLRQLDSTLTLDERAQRSKAELLEAILEHDVEIRRQLVARRDELGKLIGISQRQRNLHRAYAPQQGNSDAFYALGEADTKRST